MPNHVENIITLKGDEQRIREMLEAIQNDELGLGTVDFNKIIPMPESLNIESGSRTDRGLKAYSDFIDVYVFSRNAEEALNALQNIPRESEDAFLRKRYGFVSIKRRIGLQSQSGKVCKDYLQDHHPIGHGCGELWTERIFL